MEANRLMGSVLFYLLRNPSAAGVEFLEPVGLFLAAALWLFWMIRAPGARAATWLRSAAFLCLTGVLAQLHLSARLPSDELTLVAAVDLSDSVDEDGREWAHRYLNEIAGALAPGDRLGVVTFAEEAAVDQPPQPPGPIAPFAVPPSRMATNIASAIDTALALFPAEGNRQLLLITDGHETRGSSRSRVARLTENGIQLDVAVPPHNNHPDVSIDKLVVAPVVAETSVFPLRLIAHNTGERRPVVLSLFVSDVMVDSAAIELQSGLNKIEFPYRLTGAGAHRLRAELESPGDAIPGNNSLEVPIMVTGKARILLVTPHRRSLIGDVLRRKGIEVETRAPGGFPRSIEKLLAFDCVLVEDMTAAGLPSRALDTLKRYVQELGGGFILAGGPNTFGDPAFRSTALKELLPVTLEPRRPGPRAREPLALFLIVDRSNSMGYNSRIRTLRDGEKLRYAKQAALAVIQQLKDQDRLGLIAFDSQAHEIAPLQPLEQNRARLESEIPRLVENGGTDFFDALSSARDQLATSRVSRRHIILLTDGDTNRAAGDHYPLMEQLRDAEISVTTIRIGDDDVNLRLLEDISAHTGGEFHHVQDVEILPDLMLRDTTRALAPAETGEEFFPEPGDRVEILKEIPRKNVPPLAGYAYARAKPGADVPLHISRIDRRDPLLAVWHYGLGRVAAFTASPADDAEQWPGWVAFGKFWSQLVRWTSRKEGPWDYAIDVRKTNGHSRVLLQTFGPTTDGATLRARFHETEDRAHEIDLVPEGPRLFSGLLPNVPPGRYPLVITQRPHRVEHLDERAVLITIPERDQESREEHRRRGTNGPLLTQLTQATGGKLNPMAKELVRRDPGTRQLHVPLEWVLIPMAMLFFLGDVAVRKLWR